MNGQKLSSTFKVGWRFRCFLSIDLDKVAPGRAIELECRWHPKMPRRLSPSELAEYRCGRDAFLDELACATALKTLSIETGTGAMRASTPPADPAGAA
jgi:hypothetical protein